MLPVTPRPMAGFLTRSARGNALAAATGLALAAALCARADEPEATDPLPDRITVATWNVEWFYDHYRGDNRSDLARQQSAPSAEEWQWKLQQVARVVAEMQPTILALQEIEGRDVVYRLCRTLQEEHQLDYRIAFVPGYDFHTEQQVAVIYQSGLVEYSRREQSRPMYESQQYYNIQKHLFAHFEWSRGGSRESLRLVTVHFRAAPEGADVRQKQARLLRRWLEPALQAGENVVALGDFNSECAFGEETPDCELMLLRAPDPARPVLTDLNAHLAAADRATHLIGKQFDRILVSAPLAEDDPARPDLVFRSIARYQPLVVQGTQDTDHRVGYYDIPQAERDVSDHYPLMAEFVVQ